MTFSDWVKESARRYREQSAMQATKKSAHHFRMGMQRRILNRFGKRIWEHEQFDVLVILDACRYDLWDEVAPEYDLATGNTVFSNASCSIDWVTKNFAECPDEIENVAYVTANPFADHNAADARSADLKDSPIGHLRCLYETEWGQVDTDPPIETVPPERVTDHAIECWRNREEYGIDTMVVHYMQPHEPYITRPEWSYYTPHDNPVLKNLVDEEYAAGTSPWRVMVESGEISVEEFWGVYCDNLRWVLDDVTDRLLKNLAAENVIISADHGNALGEWGEWHHPPGAISPPVRKVPWNHVESADRQTVSPDIDATVGVDTEETTTEERLSALGYK